MHQIENQNGKCLLVTSDPIMEASIILICCVDTTHTWELRAIAIVGAKYSKLSGKDIVLVLEHEPNAAMFLVIPELLSLQGLHGPVIMHVETCVEVLDVQVLVDSFRP